MPVTIKPALLLFFLSGLATAGWLPTIDTITNRTVSDVTCQGNAHAVAEDTFGNIHVVWRGALSGVQHVWYSRLNIEADTWTTDTVISDTGPVTDPAMAADSAGNIIVVWTGGSRLYARRRLGASGQWLPIVSAAGSSGDSSVSVACDRLGIAHIVWLRCVSTGQLVLHAECDDAIGVRVDTVCPQTPVLRWPSVSAAPSGDLIVVWNRSGDWHEIIARRRSSRRWLEPETVYNYLNCTSPSVARTPDGSFHVVWATGQTSGPNAVLYRRRTLVAWEDTFLLAPYSGRKRSPSVAGSPSGDLRAAWVASDAQGRYQTLSRCRLSGDTWARAETLGVGMLDADRTSVSAGDGTSQVVWIEQLLAPPQPWQVRLRRYYEHEHDVGVLWIEQPGDTVDSGAFVTPAARIGNWGNVTEHFVHVAMRIGRETLSSLVDSLPAGDSARVVFAEWQARVLGRLTVRCSSSVSRDTRRQNDTASGAVFVRLRDVMADSILSPVGEIESLSIVPRLLVRNRGNVRDSFWCRCCIESDTGSVYEDLKRAGVDSAGTVTVAMRQWPTQPGSYRVRFALDGNDAHPENDTVSAVFAVVRHDVGVAQLVWPSGKVDSGEVGTPKAVVKNFGSRTESFRVLFRIEAGYTDTVDANDLGPGDTAEVAFAEWQARQRGNHAVSCSTLLGSDRIDSNDCRRTSVSVIVRDAACTRIIRPVDVVSRGQVEPEAWFENHGTDTVEMSCWFEIAREGRREYLDSARLRLAPGAGHSVEFIPWFARSGHYVSRAWTGLNSDMRPENDTTCRDFIVPRIDAALRQILEPTARFEARAVVPKVRVANLGEMPAGIRVNCRALLADSTVAYSGTYMALALPETTETVVNMPVWNALPGLYRFIAWAELPGDSNPENDSAAMTVAVESTPLGRWSEMAPMPDGARGIPVRGGSGLVATPTNLFALKGSNSGEWYRYCIEADSWQAVKPVPAEAGGRRAGRGAVLASGRDSIFLLRGMGTHDMLVYMPNTDSWQAAPSLPGQTRGIRFGSGIAFVPVQDTGNVYCLRGGGTRDYLVYWCRQGQWHARRSVPAGETGRGARRGSALVSLGSRVFCLLGVTNELFEYTPKGDSWIRRRSLPLVSRHGYLRRSRAGAGLAADGSRFLYALKGGGCNEFWRYDAQTDNWTQLDDVPRGSDQRRVKAGAGIAVCDGSIWVLKGGGCNEFWRYKPTALLTRPTLPERTAAAGEESNVDQLRPVAVIGTNVRLPADVVELRVRDVAGRLIFRQAGAAGISCLSPGVYFIECRDATGVRTFRVHVLH